MAWVYGVLIAIGAAVVLTLLVEVVRRTPPDPPPPVDWMAQLVRSEVIVHTTGGSSIRGFARELPGGALELTAALYLGDAGSTTVVDGAALIPREQIAWIQTGIGDREREQVTR
jgi:hypothetical protein